jgi:hypothetical protein
VGLLGIGPGEFLLVRPDGMPSSRHGKPDRLRKQGPLGTLPEQP